MTTTTNDTIRRLRNGSIDINFYIHKSHNIRSQVIQRSLLKSIQYAVSDNFSTLHKIRLRTRPNVVCSAGVGEKNPISE